MTPKGLLRRHPICLALVPGGQNVWDTFLRGARTVAAVDDTGAVVVQESRADGPEAEAAVAAAAAAAGATEAQAKETGGKKKAKKTAKAKTKGKKEDKEVAGIGVRRRYYFTSKGVRISNLIVT